MSALVELAEVDRLRRAAQAVRQRVLAELPELLETFADTAMARGAHVYWASTAVEARDYVARVVQAHDTPRVTMARSVVIEEIELARALEARGSEVVGADGELVFDAEIGITGADLAVAETGSIVLVGEDTSGRLVTALPRAHVVILGIERLVANWAQADLMLSLVARSATGEWPTSSTSVISGPRGTDELDGPDELHVIVLDDGRSSFLTGDGRMSGCARCGGRVGAGVAHTIDPEPAVDTRHAERAAWQMWAAAWSESWTYDATTHAASWGRLATGLAGQLPTASASASTSTASASAGGDLPTTAERFRDRWRKGLV